MYSGHILHFGGVHQPLLSIIIKPGFVLINEKASSKYSEPGLYYSAAAF